MVKRFCDTDIWQKDWFLNLNDKQKLLAKFIYDNCNCAGIYEISWKMLKVFFDGEITKDDFLKIKQIRFINENTIFVEDFIKFQCSVSDLNSLNPNNNAHKGIIKILKKYNLFLGASEPHLSPTLAPNEGHICGAQEKEKEKEEEEIKEKEEIKKEEKEITDPLLLYSKIKEKYDRLTGKRGFLNSYQTEKLYILFQNTTDFLETFSKVCRVLQALQNDDNWKKNIGYSPGLDWIIKDDFKNYTAIRNGSYDYILEQYQKKLIDKEINKGFITDE